LEFAMVIRVRPLAIDIRNYKAADSGHNEGIE
jgi:hypothetical protein